METFFKAALEPVKDDGAAKDAVAAWLRLTQELKQDGFYRFATLKDSLAVAEEKGERKASGKFEVKQGGRGELTAALTFSDKGALVKAAEDNKIMEGVRPICQATKLLDPDPVVRRMAEKDVLVMGRAAKDYLDEQRAKAPPELRKAIDRVWQRILDEGW
jgi:hypothetical protein